MLKHQLAAWLATGFPDPVRQGKQGRGTGEKEYGQEHPPQGISPAREKAGLAFLF